MSRRLKHLTFTLLMIFALVGIIWAYAVNQPASIVLGQGNFTLATANNGGLSALSLNGPFGISGDSSHLFVADTLNNRVLVFNPIPAFNGASATWVMGQGSFVAGNPNQAGAPTSLTMDQPKGVYDSGTTVYVADTVNNRILVFPAIPSSNDPAAAMVVGQNSMSVTTTGLTSTTLNTPYGVFADSSHLYVADNANNRVLLYNLPIAASGPAAVSILGQTLFTTNTSGTGAAGLSAPQGVYADASHVFVADTSNNRVLIYNFPLGSPPVPAAFAIGQTCVTGCVSAN